MFEHIITYVAFHMHYIKGVPLLEVPKPTKISSTFSSTIILLLRSLGGP